MKDLHFKALIYSGCRFSDELRGLGLGLVSATVKSGKALRERSWYSVRTDLCHVIKKCRTGSLVRSFIFFFSLPLSPPFPAMSDQLQAEHGGDIEVQMTMSRIKHGGVWYVATLRLSTREE